ncbi:MAG: hypothetical protein H0V37_05830 [Chloroflexia bacterium]|nr:hypothetical protein [Chloroflexia bacterium]
MATLRFVVKESANHLFLKGSSFRACEKSLREAHPAKPDWWSATPGADFVVERFAQGFLLRRNDDGGVDGPDGSPRLITSFPSPKARLTIVEGMPDA